MKKKTSPHIFFVFGFVIYSYMHFPCVICHVPCVPYIELRNKIKQANQINVNFHFIYDDSLPISIACGITIAVIIIK